MVRTRDWAKTPNVRRSSSICLKQAFSGLSSPSAIADTHDMITKNIGMLLLAIYLIVVGIVTLTGLGIGIITGVLALLAGIFILIGR